MTSDPSRFGVDRHPAVSARTVALLPELRTAEKCSGQPASAMEKAIWRAQTQGRVCGTSRNAGS
jgi:hypothetical protein